jgi:hypothetical protein
MRNHDTSHAGQDGALTYGRFKSHAWRQVISVLSLVLCAAPVVLAQKVASDYDTATDFSRFKTYAWVDGFSAAMVNVDLYIKMAIEADFEKKGLHKTEPKDADLLVTYNAARDTNINISSFHDPTYAATGGEPMLGTTMWSSGSTVGSVGRYISKGTLAIVIYDRQQRKVIWEASAKDTIKEGRSDRLKQLDKALDKILVKYPPKKK